MMELRINDVRVPLFDHKVSITKQVNKIGELKDRQATFTNKFRAKRTSAVNTLIQSLGITGNISRFPYEVQKAKLIYKGVEIIPSGSCQITSLGPDYIDIVVLDGNIFLFQEIGDKKLNELDWSALDHTLDDTNYINSFSNTEGYIYAVSDNGQFTPNLPTGIEYNYQLPAIFYSTILETIFQETSFTYEGSIFSDPRFLNLVMTLKRGYNSELDAITIPVNINTSFDVDVSNHKTWVIGQSGEEIYTWYARFNLGLVENQEQLQNGIITFTEDSQYQFDWNIDFNCTWPSYVEIKLTNITSGGIVFSDIRADESGAQNTTESIIVSAVAGEQFAFSIRTGGTGRDDEPPNQENFAGTFDVSDTSTTIIDIGIGQFIGDLSISTFLKDFMQHFGLMISIDTNSTVYKFKRMQEILNDREGSEDWSSKFVKAYPEKYALKKYAQKNRFAYNYYNSDREPFADGFLEIDNANLKPEGTHLTRPFNACDTSKILVSSMQCTKTPFWEAERDDDGTITRYNPVSNKNYIAEVKWNWESINFSVTGGLGTAFIGQLPRLSFKNLHYQHLINQNYKNIKSILDWNMVLDCDIRLTPQEVRDFDFTTLKYIKQLSSYFLVNEVKFSGGETSKVELVRVSNIEPCDLVSDPGSYKSIDKFTGIHKMVLNGLGSLGTIDSWKWEKISYDGFGSGGFTFDNNESATTYAYTDGSAGTYVIRLTITNNKGCESFQDVEITTNA